MVQGFELKVLAVKRNSNDAKDSPAAKWAFAQRAQNSKQELDRRLDQALEETFPASDPVSIIIAITAEMVG